MDGVDDLAAVDPLKINAGDAEICVPQLALDDDQGDTLASHLHRVGVSELVLVPTSAQAPLSRHAGCADPDKETVAYGTFVASASAYHEHP
jgi:hypothetical protein